MSKSYDQFERTNTLQEYENLQRRYKKAIIYVRQHYPCDGKLLNLLAGNYNDFERLISRERNIVSGKEKEIENV